MFPLKDSIPHLRTPWITYGIILLNVVVFWWEYSQPVEAIQDITYVFGIVPVRYTSTDPNLDPEWWMYVMPFFSTIFLHGGLGHLLGNMWSLHIFGDNVEDSMGRWNYLAFYIVCGLMASITHIVTNADSTIPTIGASGAIAGVMGAYLFLYPKGKLLFFVPLIFIWFIQLPAWIYLGYWFLIQFMNGSYSGEGNEGGGVAYYAHIGGFLAGAILYRFFIIKGFVKTQYANRRLQRAYSG